jgi:hypothetical protein
MATSKRTTDLPLATALVDILGHDADGHTSRADLTGLAAALAGTLSNVELTANGIAVRYELGFEVETPRAAIVAVDGVVQAISTYTVAGGFITFSEAPPTGAKLDIRVIGEAVPVLLGDTFTASGTGAVSRLILNKLADTVSVKDFGAYGNGSYDDTAAINAALATGKPVFFPAGVYVCSNGIDLPAGARLIGAGAPKLGVFPQSTDDKRFLRPGYKDEIPGSVLLFTGTGTKTTTTPRVDRFASFTYCVRTTTSAPVSLEGLAIVMDMDVLDADGDLTETTTDNRAAYDVGYLCGADRSYHRDLVIFGYFAKAGLVVHGSNPDYITFDGGSSSGDIGCAIIGDGTNGLSGTQFYGWDFFANDHHSRSIITNQWGTTALYIDGAVAASPPNAGIGGHYFTGGCVRTYTDNPLSFDHCNCAVLTGVVLEWPNLPGSTGATVATPLATSSTYGVAFENCRHLAAIGSGGIYAMANAMGGPFVHSDPRYGELGVVGAGGGVMLRGGTSGQLPRVQLTTDANSSTTGWQLVYDTGNSNILDFRNAGTSRFALDTGGGLQKAGFAHGGTKTIASGSIAAGSYNYYSVDTEASAATDDLDTITGGVYDGQLLLLRAANSSRDVVCKDGTGNLRLVGDLTLTHAQNRLLLAFDGTNWVEVSRSESTSASAGGPVSVKDFGAAGNGTTDDTTAFTNALASGAKTVFVPAGVYKLTQTLSLPQGVTLEGEGVDEWEPVYPTRAKKWGGTVLLFAGTGTRATTFAGVTSMRYGGGWRTDGADTRKLTSFYNANASGTTAATQRTFSVAVRNATGAYYCGLRNLRIANWSGADGMSGHSDTGSSSLGDSWDIGLLLDNTEYFLAENIQVVGTWREFGLLDISTAITESRSERNHVHRAKLQGRVGLGIRGTDRWAVTAATATTVDLHWSEEHYWAASGSFRGQDGVTYAYTGRSFAGSTLTLTGVTPDPSAVTQLRHPGTGFANTEFYDCYVYGLDHVSGSLASVLGLSDSKALEVSGYPLRGIKLRNCKFHTDEPVTAHLHDAMDIMCVDPQFEGGGKMIASPVSTDAGAWAAAAVGETRNLVMLGDNSMDDSAELTLFTPRCGLVQGLQVAPRDELTNDFILTALRTGLNTTVKTRSSGNFYVKRSTGSGAFRVTDSGNVLVEGGGQFSLTGGSGIMNVDASATFALRQSTTTRLQMFSTGNFAPGSDNALNFGVQATRWANVYGTNFRPGAGTATWTSGTGTPEGSVTATVGSLFTRTDGGASTTLYCKESGSGNTGWIAK